MSHQNHASKFPRTPPKQKAEKNSAAFCPRASCGWRTDGRTELVREGEEWEEEEAVSAPAAPLIISSVAAGRVTIDSTTLPPTTKP